MARKQRIKISLNIEKEVNTQIQDVCINYKNSKVDISRTTYINLAIKEQLKRDSKK